MSSRIQRIATQITGRRRIADRFVHDPDVLVEIDRDATSVRKAVAPVLEVVHKAISAKKSVYARADDGWSIAIVYNGESDSREYGGLSLEPGWNLLEGMGNPGQYRLPSASAAFKAIKDWISDWDLDNLLKNDPHAEVGSLEYVVGTFTGEEETVPE